MTDEKYENPIVGRYAPRKVVESLLDIVFGRTGVYPLGIALRTFGQIDHVGRGQSQPFLGRVVHGSAPAIKRLAVLRLTANAAHDEDMTVSRERLCRKDSREQRNNATHHLDQPPHSPVTPLDGNQYDQQHKDHRHVPEISPLDDGRAALGKADILR